MEQKPALEQREHFEEVIVEVIGLEDEDVVTSSNLLIPDEEETK